MRKPVLLIFVNACILILVFVLLGQSLFVVQRVARTRAVSGGVALQRGGAGPWQALLMGEVIKSGDVVKTEAGSWAEFGWQNGTRWRLAPESQLKVEKALLNPNKATETANFRLESGTILMRVAGTLGAHSRFEVETPSALIAVRGTVFSVAVERSQTQVRVFQGQVDVYNVNRDKKTTIAPGQKAQASLLELSTTPDTDPGLPAEQSGFLEPELSSNVRVLKDNKVLLQGRTETGAKLSIDGAQTPVLGNGQFLKRFKIAAGKTGWKIQSTDKYGAKNEVWQPLPTGYE